MQTAWVVIFYSYNFCCVFCCVFVLYDINWSIEECVEWV